MVLLSQKFSFFSLLGFLGLGTGVPKRPKSILIAASPYFFGLYVKNFLENKRSENRAAKCEIVVSLCRQSVCVTRGGNAMK
ncbi:hypothetical protein Mal48_15590 [Thalassoglobus polymorphus]|uniref:Uncharacterized protein n=1 Tax=Thalassoglobus polymorphus TaxID=2527994 RepID=A0A517QL09_9PLAN|nr:hypothetical protein Mal48_15590 [Thalassoglobus polymorphus]